jgi:hypothetical protein
MVQNIHEPALVKGKTMNSHNAKTEPVTRNESVGTGADREDVRVIESSLVEASELSISENCDQGSDPYNSTGQHVIIKSRIDLQD